MKGAPQSNMLGGYFFTTTMLTNVLNYGQHFACRLSFSLYPLCYNKIPFPGTLQVSNLTFFRCIPQRIAQPDKCRQFHILLGTVFSLQTLERMQTCQSTLPPLKSYHTRQQLGDGHCDETGLLRKFADVTADKRSFGLSPLAKYAFVPINWLSLTVCSIGRGRNFVIFLSFVSMFKELSL